MPYASNQGVRIYYEVEGDGPPLVLQHGSACSSAEWREMGYSDVLRWDYQLILIDARGHERVRSQRSSPCTPCHCGWPM